MIICDNCNSKEVEVCQSMDTSTYKGTEYQVEMHYSTCHSCGEESIDKKQYLVNESNIREAKKKIDGLLLAENLKNIRDQLNLTQAQAADVFGGGPNAFSKYERKEVTQSKSMDKLLRLAAEDTHVFKKLLTWSKVDSSTVISSTSDSLKEAIARAEIAISNESGSFKDASYINDEFVYGDRKTFVLTVPYEFSSVEKNTVFSTESFINTFDSYNVDVPYCTDSPSTSYDYISQKADEVPVSLLIHES